MAASSSCRTCLRTLRQHSRALHLQQQHLHPRTATAAATSTSPILSHSHRSLSTSSPSHAEAASKKTTPPPPKTYNTSSSTTTSSPITGLAAQLRQTSALRSTTEPYIAYGGTEDLFLECSRQCSYTMPSALASPPTPPPRNAADEDIGEGTGWWFEPRAQGGFGLDVTFNTWAQVLFLHMWLLTVRLRGFPAAYVRDWHQNLLDHFFYAAEDRMATWHAMSARSVRNKNLKDLWLQWRGVLLSYDEGLIKGDAVLAAALWRNLFKASPDVDLTALAHVTAYTLRELQMLGNLDDAVVAEGRVRFGDPRSVFPENGVIPESPLLRKPVTEQELQDLARELQR